MEEEEEEVVVEELQEEEVYKQDLDRNYLKKRDSQCILCSSFNFE